MSLKKLSVDELGQISEYTKKVELSKLKPLIGRSKKEFKEIDERRCREREYQFKKISGISLEDFIDKLKDNHSFIDKTIDEVMKKNHPNIKLSEASRKYFHDLFGFTFNMNDIVELYIDTIISGTSPFWEYEDIPEDEENVIEIENLIDPSPELPLQDINYNAMVNTEGFNLPTSYNDATMDFQIFRL